MFNVSNSKNEITVEHVLNIAKTAVLPAGTLTSAASIDLGLDLKSSEGGDIVTKFEKVFNKNAASGLKKLHDRLDKTRTRLEKMLHDGDPEVKIRQYADTQQEDIIRDWNQFSRVDLKKMALDAVDNSIKALGKKTSVVFKNLKIGFSSQDMKDSQHEFLTGIIDRPEDGSMGRAPTSGMAGLVAGLTDIAGKTAPVLAATLEGNLKLLKQAVTDANTLKSNIVVLNKTIQAMQKKLERISKIEAATGAKTGSLAATTENTANLLEAAHKTTVLNDAEKLAQVLQQAHSEFADSSRKVKSVTVPDGTANISQLLAQAQKQLDQAGIMLQQESEAVLDAARRTNAALTDTKTGSKLVVAALKEFKLQSKIK